MIKRQYSRWCRNRNKSYFDNFIDASAPIGLADVYIEDKLLSYNATIAKSKNKYSKLNVKWHDPKLYTIFVLKWS